jgi:hypothetical protein
MPIIFATWETEMGKIEVPGKPGQKKFVRPHLNRKKAKNGGMHISGPGKKHLQNNQA